MLGTLVLTTAVLKINDWNLYSSSLGLVNSINVLFGRKVSRVRVTLVIGVAGTALSAMGIVHFFPRFLTTVGILAPPVAGVLIAEYFIVRRCRPILDVLREQATITLHRDWVPLALLSWVAGATSAVFADFGIATINSMIVAFAVYSVAGRLLPKRHAFPIVKRHVPLVDTTNTGGH